MLVSHGGSISDRLCDEWQTTSVGTSSKHTQKSVEVKKNADFKGTAQNMALFQSRTDKSWTGLGRMADRVPAAKMFDSEMKIRH